jgi:hypothetical protein
MSTLVVGQAHGTHLGRSSGCTRASYSNLNYGTCALHAGHVESVQAAAAFAARQISRIGVVGSNEMTGPVIEASWRRFLEVFDAHIQNQPFLLGHRPGAGDFACCGQMTMLVITDPTPAAVGPMITILSLYFDAGMRPVSTSWNESGANAGRPSLPRYQYVCISIRESVRIDSRPSRMPLPYSTWMSLGERFRLLAASSSARHSMSVRNL